ncbi:MAG: hypothetical protein Q9209_005914 [Squamulea sp. 1 TL-2023]
MNLDALNALSDTEYRKLIDKWLEGPARKAPHGASPNYLDDTSFGAWLGLIAFGIVMAECDRYGAGLHIWNVTARQYLDFSRVRTAIDYQIAFKFDADCNPAHERHPDNIHSARALRIAIYVNIWANVLFYVIGFFVTLLICLPRKALWDPYVRNIKCLNIVAAELASAVFNAVSDFAILILPISAVWQLRMQRKKKMAVLAVFVTGLLWGI